jgi:Asp-tRNA(Asn)/Glu-tRNA(Gln) amidotransferase C subunit
MHEREDVVTEPNQVDEILLNAPASQHHMFAVPKMVES